jgi:dienelactone hydrolase
MSRIEAIGESRIKRDVDCAAPCGLIRRRIRESIVGLEEFVRITGRFSALFGILCAVAAGASVILLSCVFAAPRLAASAGPQGAEQGEFRAQPWLVPSAQPGVLMRTTLLRPPGPGPFRLVVVNHGTTQNAERRRALPLPQFETLSAWFVRHGFAVAVPERPGHGATGGDYREDQGGCDDADFARAGLGAADSIAAALAYLQAQPFVRRNGAILAGHSAGGWGALALASRAPAGLAAVVNFAGGLGGRSYDQPDNNCAPQRLIATAGAFGRTTRVPTLWLYAENDSYFPPRLSGAMAAAFRAAGGKVDYRLLPASGAEGHFVVLSPGSESIWGPVVERFLATLR